jgi:hypothetical protein
LTPSPPRARRFGIEIGGLLLVVALLLFRRGVHPRSASFAAVVGAVLIAVALGRPALLAPLARRWMALATAISRITTPIVLGVVYLAVLTPMGWLRRTVGRSPIARDDGSPTYWIRREQRPPESMRSDMDHQY